MLATSSNVLMPMNRIKSECSSPSTSPEPSNQDNSACCLVPSQMKCLNAPSPPYTSLTPSLTPIPPPLSSAESTRLNNNNNSLVTSLNNLVAGGCLGPGGSENCAGCTRIITDRFLLRVNCLSWHQNCLRCCVCQLALDRQPSCFIRDRNVYCKSDYSRSFGARCSKCCRPIGSADWVRRARDRVYHLACFACDACKRQLSTGEEFALHESKVLCKQHYLEAVEGGATSNDENTDGEGGQRKSKRVRTTFTDEQLQVLQANFQIDSNPDSQDLERIAQLTGLSKRVTQVWFQNSRARQKKHMTSKKHHQGLDRSLHDLTGNLARTIDLHFMYSFRPQSVEPEDMSSPENSMVTLMSGEA